MESSGASAFYATRRGEAARGVLAARLASLPGLPPLNPSGRALLLGWPDPYRFLWPGQSILGFLEEPRDDGALLRGESLPFPDLVFDRVLVIHALEVAREPRRLLREAWRVLRDDGHLVLITPNRLGAWAQTEATAFGQGTPYAPGQIARLLRDTLFAPELSQGALYIPPVAWGGILRLAPFVERIGRALAPQLGGVTLTVAQKDLYAALPTAAHAPARRIILSEAA